MLLALSPKPIFIQARAQLPGPRATSAPPRGGGEKRIMEMDPALNLTPTANPDPQATPATQKGAD